MTIIKTFHVYTVTDRGNVHFAHFLNVDEAKKACAIAGGYGGEVREEVILAYESVEELIKSKLPDLKESALSKLTKEERYALGL